MFEGAFHQFPTAETPAAPEPAVVWLDQPATTTAGAAEAAVTERDPQDVIEFLLKKVEEQQAKLAEQDEYAELQNQELDQLRGQVQVAREELDRQLADYDVLMQNSLATERELELLKRKSGEAPKISLPFHTEQKLAKLGYGEGDAQAS